MSDDVAIKVEHVSKGFKLPHDKENSIKGGLISLVKNGKRTYEKQEVLKDISFEIKKGDFFGIVGRNGSGKSTLLKMLAGIYTPTAGSIQVNGSLTPFIELGVGFNPELTGRENVYLNGALLGFNRKQMAEMYDDIVEFAELERFMDQKLKNYSSGMQVRLAFSIAIRAKSDILLLDEVLAVGDEAFQQKCIDVFETYKREKQTVILVTHSMDTVRRFCTKAMLLDAGEITHYGKPEEVAEAYSQLNTAATESDIDKKNSSKLLSAEIELTIMNKDNHPTSTFNSGDKMHVNVQWPTSLEGVQNVGVAIIMNTGEFVFGANTLGKKHDIKGNSIQYEVELDLGPGKYHLMAGLFGATQYDIIHFLNIGPEFMIKNDPKDLSHGIARLNNNWR